MVYGAILPLFRSDRSIAPSICQTPVASKKSGDDARNAWWRARGSERPPIGPDHRPKRVIEAIGPVMSTVWASDRGLATIWASDHAQSRHTVQLRASKSGESEAKCAEATTRRESAEGIGCRKAELAIADQADRLEACA